MRPATCSRSASRARRAPLTQIVWVLGTGVVFIVPVALLWRTCRAAPRVARRRHGGAGRRRILRRLLLPPRGLQRGRPRARSRRSRSLQGAYAVAPSSFGPARHAAARAGPGGSASSAACSPRSRGAPAARGAFWALRPRVLVRRRDALYGYAGEISWLSQAAVSRRCRWLSACRGVPHRQPRRARRSSPRRPWAPASLELCGLLLVTVSLSLGRSPSPGSRRPSSAPSR